MKKISIILASILLMGTFCGCDIDIHINDKASVQDKQEKQIIETEREDILHALSDEETEKLNMFLSNFSETHLSGYERGEELNRYELVCFAFNHHLINNSDAIVYQGNEMGISAANVNYSLDRFFGISIPEADTNKVGNAKWEYRDGYFMSPSASGLGVAFSIATEMEQNDDGTYSVDFDVFYVGHDTSIPMSDWYRFSLDEARANFEYDYSGEAVIRKKIHAGKESYEILEYETEGANAPKLLY